MLRRPSPHRLSLLFWAALAAGVAQAQEPTAEPAAPENAAEAAAARPDDLQQQLRGAWVLTGEPGTDAKPQGADARLKFFGDGYWCITEADPATGALRYHHGGVYTLDGDTLEETIAFAGPSTVSLIGKKHRFRIALDGDSFVQTALDGNPFNEVWERR